MHKRIYSDYIDDIKISVDYICDFTKGLDFITFSNDNKTLYAVIRCFEIIGEAAKRIPVEIREKTLIFHGKYSLACVTA